MTAFLTIGHRGASGHEPENTLRSIRRALEMGANGIEIDVRLSRDGHPVVIHDATLRRTTGASGRVAAFTLDQLRQLDAECGESIPTLREALELVAGRAWLNLELKAPGTAIETVREVARALRRDAWKPGQIVISSFNRRELAAVHGCQKTSPEVKTGLLLSRPFLALGRIARRFGAGSVHLPRHLATMRAIRQAKRAGLQVLVFTVNDPAEMARLRDWGVDGVFTDFPDRAPLSSPIAAKLA